MVASGPAPRRARPGGGARWPTLSGVSVSRLCSRAACPHPATSTLTYVYSDSTVVLGPLATYAEPHAYDLCQDHASRLTAPRGWEVLRLDTGAPPPSSHDDLVALAEVVRRRPAPAAGTPAPLAPSRGQGAPAVSRSAESATSARETGRRGHLRVLRDPS